MGLDLSAMWDDAKKAASQGMQDALNQGGNAGLGYLEGQAISIIQADQSKHEQAAQNAAKEMLDRPPSKFGSYLTNLYQQPIIKQYGVYILAGAAVLIGATLMLRGK